MANKRIQGITIELDADVQPIESALGKLNKDINSVESDLKNVEKALKLNPGDVDQVNRKLELLAEKAELSEKKVDALKQAQAKMDASGVDKSSKAYQDLQTELSKAESELRGLSTEMERTSKSSSEVVEGQKQLSTYLKATGQDAESLVSLIGSKLVDAYKSGQLGAAGYQKALEAISKATTGSKNNVNELKRVLSSVDDGGSLDEIRRELEQIGRVSVSGLGSEFDALNQKSAALDTELKEINASLKLDPSSLDLCAQKQQVLTQAVNESEQKLKLLNQRFSELKSANVDLNDEEFRTLQREITNTESALTGYKTSLTDLQNAQQRLNTYFAATGTSVRDFSNILGSELISKIERGEASSEELAQAFNKIGASATSNRGELDQLKASLDGIGNGVSLENIKADLSRVGQEAQGTKGEVNELGEGFSELGSKLDTSNLLEAFEAVTDAVGMAVEAVKGMGSASLDAASTVEESQNQVRISLGVTKEEAAAVAEHAHSVWKQNFGDTQQEVTEVMVNIQKQIQGVNDSNLEDITKKFLTLQQAGMDNEEAMRAVNSAMQAFGVDANTALDMLTSGFQNINDPMHELGDVVSEYSPQFRQAGYSAEEMLGVLKAGGDSGARSLDLVADLIKEMGIRLADGSIASAVTDLDAQFSGMGVNFQGVMDDMTAAGASPKEIFQALVGEINKLPNEMDQATAASALFGTQAEDCTIPVVKAIAAASGEYGNFAGAADQAVAANETATGTMMRNFEDLFTALAPIGEALAGVANTILDAVMPAFEQFGNLIGSLFSGDISMSDYFDQVVAGYDSLISTIKEKFPEWKDSAIEAIKNFADGFFEAWPDVLSKIGELLGEVLPDLVTFIAEAAAAIVQAIGEHAPEILNGVAELLGNLIKGILEHLPDILQAALELFMSLMTAIQQIQPELLPAVAHLVELIIQGLGSALGGIWEVLKNFFADLWNQTGPAFQPFADALVGAWNGIWTTIQEGWEAVVGWFAGIFAGIGETVGGAWNAFCTMISTAWNNIWLGIQTAWETVSGWFSTAFTAITETVGPIWDAFCTAITSAWETLVNGIQTIWNNVSGAVSSAWSSFCSGVESTWDGFCKAIDTAWSNLTTNIQNIWNTFSGAISSAWDSFCKNVESLWNSFTDSVKSIFEKGLNAVKSTWDSISNAIKSAWDTFCSTVSNVWNSFVSNVKSIWDSGMNTVRSIAEQVSSAVVGAINSLVSQGQNIFESFKNAIANVWNSIKSTAEQVWSSIVNSVKGFIDNLYNMIVGTFDSIRSKVEEIWGNISGTVGGLWDQVSGFIGINYTVDDLKPVMPVPEWHAKGGILTAPTLFTHGNTLHGAGEAGAEAVLPIDNLNGMINTQMTGALNSEVVPVLTSLLAEIKALNESSRHYYNSDLNRDTQVVMDTGALVGELSSGVDQRLARNQKLSRRR